MTALFLALILVFIPCLVGAQESAPPAPAESPVAGPGTPSAQTTAESLVSSTLGQDIATDSYYELVAWCQELGLSDTGSRNDLQTRLAQHFKVSLPAAEAAAKRTVTVRSARESEYYTDPDVNEKYVLLRGDVVIEVRDETNATLQVIKAATVTYNQTKKTVSAEGNVTYTLTRGGKTDTFTGARLAFDLESSQAVFYDGRTTRTITKGGKDVSYTFKGQTISRMQNDTVILDEGSFTSSENADDPLYSVHASKVWILGPGEWAIQNAVLMIGRVPIMYLPGFFLPGDDFFFNPNIGYRNREGSFLQTTTYLMGRKAKQDTPFGFLQLNESGDAGYNLELNGLFLRKVPVSTPIPDKGKTLKLMADAYSRLGFLAGLDGDFSPLATFRTSLGLSRSIFLDPTTNLYTPYLPFFASGPYSVGQEFWNSSSVFGATIPLRFGLEGTFKSTGDIYAVSADFQYFSDPSFTSDFYTRSEAGIISTVLTPPTATGAVTPQQANLSWDFTSRLDFTKAVGLPFVKSFTMPNFDMKFTWQSRDAPAPYDTYPLSADPARTFYLPASLTLPNVSLSISGDILSISTAAKPLPPPQTAPLPGEAGGVQSTAAPTEPGKGLRTPTTSTPASTKSSETPPRIPFRAPEAQKDVPVGSGEPDSSLTVSYQVQPRATLEHTFDARQGIWNRREDVDYSLLYHTFETGGTSTIAAAASLWDKLFDLSASLGADGLWRSRFDPKPSYAALPDWQSLLTSDLQQDRITIRSALQGTLRPLPAIAELSASNLQYRLGLRLYQYSYIGTDPLNPAFGSTGFTWTPDNVSEHSIQSSLVFNTPFTSDSLALTAQLAPLTPTYTGLLLLAAGPAKGKVQGGFAEISGARQYQPLVVSGTLDFGKPLNATEELQFDVSSSALSRSTSQLGLGGFSSAFVAERIQNELVPSTVRLGYESGGDPVWYWKDRIKADLSVKTHWYMNLQKYTDNLFDFTLAFNVSIYKFLDLSFSSLSDNSRTYLYFPSMARSLGQTSINPITDLINSFNFFNPTARINSSFKIRTITAKVVQHFGDWDLTFQYQGSPQLITTTDPNTAKQTTQYTWSPIFAIQVQWNAVPEIKSNIHGDNTGAFLRGS